MTRVGTTGLANDMCGDGQEKSATVGAGPHWTEGDRDSSPVTGEC